MSKRIAVWYGGMSQRIFAGNANKAGGIGDRFDVTDEVISAVIEMMERTGKDYECAAGELVFKPKGVEPQVNKETKEYFQANPHLLEALVKAAEEHIENLKEENIDGEH